MLILCCVKFVCLYVGYSQVVLRIFKVITLDVQIRTVFADPVTIVWFIRLLDTNFTYNDANNYYEGVQHPRVSSGKY